MIEITPGIIVTPQIRFGRPVISGARVPVATVIARIASGVSFTEVMEEYEITREDIFNALNYAAVRLAEEQIWLTANSLAS